MSKSKSKSKAKAKSKSKPKASMTSSEQIEDQVLKVMKRMAYETLIKQGDQKDTEMLLQKDDKHVDAVLKAFNIKFDTHNL
tara:strand:+ start:340 stop:582 length:243 start_codon:yes stop_codon:yes gene_type:complete